MAINSASVYAQKYFRLYDRYKMGWLWHSLVILPAWILFVYLLISLNNHYVFQFNGSMVGGYIIFIVATLLFGFAINTIGLQSLANGNFFGRGIITNSGPFRLLKNPIYDSYFLVFIGLALIGSNAAYFIIALESFVGLNILESHIESIKVRNK